MTVALACMLAPPPAHAQGSPQTLPEISVSATQEFVIEGEVIEFRLAAEPALPAPVTLRYRVAQSVGGDVLAAAEMRASEVSLPAGYTGGVLSIRTAQDQAPEGNAIVTLTLLPGAGYAMRPTATPIFEQDRRSTRMRHELKGDWTKGLAFDQHTLASVYLGDNAYGYPQFENTRSEMGELLYRLKSKGE